MVDQGDREQASVRFGVHEIDLRSGELRKAGVRIKVQELPLKVLTALLEHPGEIVTREDLRKRICAFCRIELLCPAMQFNEDCLSYVFRLGFTPDDC